jgi:hypothetical protein
LQDSIVDPFDKPKRSNDAKNREKIKHIEGKNSFLFSHFSAENYCENHKKIYNEHEEYGGLGIYKERIENKISNLRVKANCFKLYDF